jgi:hypothetical protein
MACSAASPVEVIGGLCVTRLASVWESAGSAAQSTAPIASADFAVQTVIEVRQQLQPLSSLPKIAEINASGIPSPCEVRLGGGVHFSDAQDNGTTPIAARPCAAPIKLNSVLIRGHRIDCVPTVIFEDESRIPGFVRAQALEASSEKKEAM